MSEMQHFTGKAKLLLRHYREMLDDALDELFKVVVPNPEELEWGDPTYATNLEMAFEKAKQALLQWRDKAVVEELEKLLTQADYYGGIAPPNAAVATNIIYNRIAQLKETPNED